MNSPNIHLADLVSGIVTEQLTEQAEALAKAGSAVAALGLGASLLVGLSPKEKPDARGVVFLVCGKLTDDQMEAIKTFAEGFNQDFKTSTGVGFFKETRDDEP